MKVLDCLSVPSEHLDSIELKLKLSVCATVCEDSGLVEDVLMGVDSFMGDKEA